MIRLNHVCRFLVLITISSFFISCQQSHKSNLVKRLEKICYDKSFAKTPATVFNVSDYGAIGDGKSLTTNAIQKTINAAHKAGGGRVVFNPGTYLTGALFVKSNVEFHISEDVTLLAIQDDKQYPELPTRIAGIEMEWPAALINVYEQSNVRITGKGTIDGNGKFWWDKFWGDPKFSGGMWVDYKKRDVRWAVDYDCKRVRTVVVYNSENILLKDFTIKRAGFWTVSLTYSNKVYVDGLIVRNNIDGYGPSSDGINTDSSCDVLVENCDIDCNDDNLCIKSGKDADGLRVNRPAENIVYRNCITRSGHGLITLGSETSGGMKNIEVYGLEAIGTNIGIRFKSAKVRGGVMENIWFHDIKMNEVDNPFHFELNWYPEYSYPKIPDNIPEEEIPERWRIITKRVTPPEKGIPEFRNIKINNVEVKGAKQAFYANAYAEKPLDNFTWENITIEADECGVINHASNWSMTSVTLTNKTEDSIKLTNCIGIEQPQIIKLENQETEPAKEIIPVQQQITELLKQNISLSIIPVNLSSKMVIAAGDSTSFSDSIIVHILNGTEAQIKYYEPLGDGFYFSPVEIESKNGGKTIEVKGQKSHTYTFLIKSENKPQNINASDLWSYDVDKKQITVIKTGINFKLENVKQNK